MEGEGPVDVPAWSVPVEWEPCSFFTGGTRDDAECADVRMPLRWDDPTAAQISVFVKRLTADGVAADEADVAVWPLSGGPGGASNLQEGLADLFLDNDEDLVFYLLDHRGVGRSQHLTCEAEDAASPGGRRIQPEEMADCAAELEDRWGDGLQGFSTSNAATDLAWLIEATRGQGQSVHIHGGSYGTRWMQRTLQLSPRIADSVSGLGVVPPSFSFADYDASFEQIGEDYLALCVEDVECVSRLGPDPLGTTRQALFAIQSGTCPVLDDSLTRERLRSFFGALLLAGGDARVAIPAIAHRIDRCNSDDRAALAWFAANVEDPLDDLRSDPLYSAVLGNLVALSELWDRGPSVSEAETLHRQGLFSLGSTLRIAQLEDAGWPRFPRDPLADAPLQTDIPVLWINGDLDPATPLDPVLAMLEDEANRPAENLLVIPGGGHEWESPTVEGYDCAKTTWWNFLRSPEEELFDCEFQILPPNLSGSEDIAWWLFGRDDLWGSWQGD